MFWYFFLTMSDSFLWKNSCSADSLSPCPQPWRNPNLRQHFWRTTRLRGTHSTLTKSNYINSDSTHRTHSTPHSPSNTPDFYNSISRHPKFLWNTIQKSSWRISTITKRLHSSIFRPHTNSIQRLVQSFILVFRLAVILPLGKWRPPPNQNGEIFFRSSRENSQKKKFFALRAKFYAGEGSLCNAKFYAGEGSLCNAKFYAGEGSLCNANFPTLRQKNSDERKTR